MFLTFALLTPPFRFQLMSGKNDFFPLNRALSLSALDEDSTESKVDDLLKFVMLMVDRQKAEVCDHTYINSQC